MTFVDPRLRLLISASERSQQETAERVRWLNWLAKADEVVHYDDGCPIVDTEPWRELFDRGLTPELAYEEIKNSSDCCET